jgi:LCP family protein required for cell wall assembly
MNDDRYRRGRRGPDSGADAAYRRGLSYEQEYDEEYWEDEEDYEEYARSMDRENVIGDSRRQSARSASRGRSEQKNTDSRGKGNAPAGGSGRRNAAPSGNGKGNSASKKKKRRKKRGVLGIFLRIIVIFLLILVIAGGFLYFRMRDTLEVLEMNRVDSVHLEKQLYESINYRVNHDRKMEGFKNIALFGVDSRSGDLLDGDNRSDTIMIASINEKTGEIHLVSVYRDTVLDVGDEYYTKANTAYALGGPAQAIAMLNRNLDLNILDFVTVGFEGLAHTIDALGGIEIEIDEEEREYLNQYVHDMHIELGTDETPVEQSGLVTLTGIQATAYSRIRYTAGDDFRRAERQRTVLEKTLEKARGASPTTLIDVANNVVGDMATSLSSREIVSMILMAPKLNLADTGGIPQEDLRDFTTIEAGSAVMPVTLSDNSTWLHQFLFDDDVYKPSEEVELRSSWIMNNLPQGVYY